MSQSSALGARYNNKREPLDPFACRASSDIRSCYAARVVYIIHRVLGKYIWCTAHTQLENIDYEDM